MKTLVEYLTEYIDYEVGDDNVLPDDVSVLKEWIEQGIEAYQSTENCTIVVKPAVGDPADCEHCRKCGENTCGNDLNHSCFELRK